MLARMQMDESKRPSHNLCVLKPDGLLCVVNTILINHLLEEGMELITGTVGKAYTPVDNGVCRKDWRVV